MTYRGICTLLAGAIAIACGTGCASPTTSSTSIAAASAATPPTVRRGFLGAFFRSSGVPPYGVFSVDFPQRAPAPYPTPGAKLFGPAGYCDAVADNGKSISTGFVVDKLKIANIVDLGVKWTRTTPEPFFDDTSHIFGHYSWGDFDSAQCALARHGIVPTIAVDAGPVQYNLIPGQFSPKGVPIYKTSADFATWCSAIAQHETKIFPAVTRYTLPGNEVNSNAAGFPGGDAQIVQYSEACYHAIKAIAPKAYIYGFELNMDSRADAVGFVQRLYDMGCKVGTCYDGLSIHLAVRYPIAPAGTPCREYSMQCIADIQAAAHAPVHLLIGETVYLVPNSVPSEAVKASAIVAEMEAFAANPAVDGVNYANIDECDMYSSGYFVGGCIVDSFNQKLPGYTALAALAKEAY